MRYLTDRAVQARHDTVFPWGTFTVNVTGCLILGALTGAALTGRRPPHVQLLLGTGLCGALTTYSTFSYETLRLAETGARFLRRRQRHRLDRRRSGRCSSASRSPRRSSDEPSGTGSQRKPLGADG